MNVLEAINEASEIQEISKPSDNSFDAISLDKYDRLMEDDKIGKEELSDVSQLSPNEVCNQYTSMFENGDFFEDSENREIANLNIESEREQQSETVAIPSDDVYETDDNGNNYKKDGELLPNNEYTVNENNIYRTDEQGRITSYESKPVYTDEGNRSLKEQKEVGGDERKSDDDGGHLVAKVLGGSEGKENLVPMRRTINRGDYKKMENEIASACKENKDVTLYGDVEYDGDSQRPSIISTEYQIEDKKVISQFDNKENSIELLDKLKDKISTQDFNSLCNEIEDMKTDGCEVSITSVKTEFDTNGNEAKITVGILDESAYEKTYKVYYPNQEV